MGKGDNMEKEFELPKDISLPFLVYGVFKPKYLSKNTKLTDKKSINLQNKNFIKEIVPLKTKYKRNVNDSYLIYFNKDYAKKAYTIISESETSRPTKWRKINVDGIKTNVLILEDNNSYYIDLPADTSLPFFAYGILKKKQLAYSKIEKYVKEQPIDYPVDYKMKIRDGVPILVRETDEKYKANGNLIYFKDEVCDDAYDVICKTVLNDLYEWGVIKVRGEDFNVLFGKNPDKGSSEFEIYRGKIKNYNGKMDPFFNESIKIIKEFNEKTLAVNEKNLLELQMHYLLLWAAIERYCDLKYANPKISKNIEEFSDEEIVKESLENLKRFKNHNFNENDEKLSVFSSKDLREYKLNPNNPEDSLKFYYTIRCNVVHRGKILIYDDAALLKSSLEDLLEIFENVLKYTFNEN